MENSLQTTPPPRCQIGWTNLLVSPVALGCWPMAGISSLNVDDSLSQATILAAIENGVNFIDTAYSYGYDGRSDRVLASVLANRWDQVVLASKVGSHYDQEKQRHIDGRPEVLQTQLDEIRLRLQCDRIDILYLHAPDPKTPIEKSAEAIGQMVAQGKVKYAAFSNGTLEQTKLFHQICPIAMVQPPFNMLQQSDVSKLAPWCQQNNISIAAYWVLMKGLLAGHLQRETQFDPADRRLSYPMYQGEQWQRNQDFVDALRSIAHRLGWSVAQLVVHWSIYHSPITVALCGAKRPEQIIEVAKGMHGKLSDTVVSEIETAIELRGQIE